MGFHNIANGMEAFQSGVEDVFNIIQNQVAKVKDFRRRAEYGYPITSYARKQ